MPAAVWIAIWAALVIGLALLVVRERRSGRRGPGDFDRTRHESVNESGTRAIINGPTNLGGGPTG